MNTTTTLEPNEHREYKIGIIIVCIIFVLICCIGYYCYYAFECFEEIDRRVIDKEYNKYDDVDEEEPGRTIL